MRSRYRRYLPTRWQGDQRIATQHLRAGCYLQVHRSEKGLESATHQVLAGLQKVRESFKFPKRLIVRNQVTLQEARFARSQPLVHWHVLFPHVLGCEQQTEVS